MDAIKFLINFFKYTNEELLPRSHILASLERHNAWDLNYRLYFLAKKQKFQLLKLVYFARK